MQRFTIYQNQSLSVRGNILFFITMCCVSFTIASVFAWHGQWLILPFAGVEMFALGLALYFCMKRLSRVETVTISDKDITVSVQQRNQLKRSRTFPKAWARASVFPASSTAHGQRLWLNTRRAKIEIGACLSNREKRQLACAMNEAILKKG